MKHKALCLNIISNVLLRSVRGVSFDVNRHRVMVLSYRIERD
jgi:hypothetical protein